MKYFIGVLIVLFASFADIFLYRIGIIPFQPSSFLLPFFLVVCVVKYSIRDLWDIFKSHTFKLFSVILLLSIVYSGFSPASVTVIKMEVVLNLLTLLLYVFLVHFFRTESKTLVFLVIFLSFTTLAASVWYDYFVGLPKFQLSLMEMARKGGFGENPNQAASALKFLGLCMLVFLQQLKIKRILFIAAMVASVFLTFSRSGIVSVILILILGTANNWSSKFQITSKRLFISLFKMAFLFTGLYIGLVMLVSVLVTNFPDFARGAMGDRIDLLLGKSKGSAISEDVGSGGGRGDLLLKYTHLFMEKPMGYGTGFTTDERYNFLNTHNYYLYLAVNLGALAMILYLVYLWYGLRISIRSNQFYYLIFIVLLMFEGLVTHHIFFNRSMLISLAFFDSLIYKQLTNES